MKKANTNYPKPILKWVGGKGAILDTLIAKFPAHNLITNSFTILNIVLIY